VTEPDGVAVTDADGVPVTVTDAVPVTELDAVPVTVVDAVPVVEDDAVPVADDDAVPVTVDDAVPVTDDDAVPVAVADAVPVAEDDAVPVTVDDAVPVADDDAVPVTELDAVPVTEPDGVPVAVDDGVGVREGLGETTRRSTSQHTLATVPHGRSLSPGRSSESSGTHPPITQSSSPPKSLGSPSDHLVRPASEYRYAVSASADAHSQPLTREKPASLAASVRPIQYVPASPPHRPSATYAASASSLNVASAPPELPPADAQYAAPAPHGSATSNPR
jgi:hypothetical protein